MEAKEDQLSVHSEAEVASLSVCQMADGCGLILEQQTMPDHTVTLSLIDVPGTVSEVAVVKPEEPVPYIHFLVYPLSDPR